MNVQNLFLMKKIFEIEVIVEHFWLKLVHFRQIFKVSKDAPIFNHFKKLHLKPPPQKSQKRFTKIENGSSEDRNKNHKTKKTKKI